MVSDKFVDFDELKEIKKIKKSSAKRNRGCRMQNLYTRTRVEQQIKMKENATVKQLDFCFLLLKNVKYCTDEKDIPVRED